MMRVVAEMMILANAAVGTAVHSAFPRAALLRRHPPPRREAFAEVGALCASLGAPLDFEGGPAGLSASLAAAAATAPPAVASLIKSLATRAMSEAEYFCTGAWGALQRPAWMPRAMAWEPTCRQEAPHGPLNAL